MIVILALTVFLAVVGLLVLGAVWPAHRAEKRRITRCRQADAVAPSRADAISPPGGRSSDQPPLTGFSTFATESAQRRACPQAGGHAVAGLINPGRARSRPLRAAREEAGAPGDIPRCSPLPPPRRTRAAGWATPRGSDPSSLEGNDR